MSGIPGYHWWKQRRTDRFKAACVEATAEERWERLGLIADTWLAWDHSSNDAHIYLAEAQFQTGMLLAGHYDTVSTIRELQSLLQSAKRSQARMASGESGKSDA